MECGKIKWKTKEDAQLICVKCKFVGCPKRVKPDRIALNKKEVSMYLAKLSNNTYKEITITDIKNPTSEEIKDVVEIYVINTVYTPVTKTILTEKGIADVKPTQRKRKSTKGNQGEV